MIPIGDHTGLRRHRFPFMMLIILIANVLVFVYQITLSEAGLLGFYNSLGVIPVEYTQGRDVAPPPPYGITWLTLLTSMFMHGGFLHIASNMLYLFVFADNVEDQFGHAKFLLFYLATGMAASATHILLNSASQIPSVGASGAIAGALAAYLLIFPRASVRTLLFLGPFITITRISAIFLIGFWFVMQLFSGIASLGAETQQTGGVAFWAHIGGFVAGLALTPLLRPRQGIFSR